MTKYRVWEKGIEEKDDAIEIDASSAEDAAFEWSDIKSNQDYFNKEYEKITLCIKNENEECSEQTIYIARG